MPPPYPLNTAPVDFSRLRIGQGWDRHRLAPGLPLMLGGVNITESPVGCEAHSDGDVLLHALIDALLGATGQGDIGEWFPPSEARWKDTSSVALLQQVLSQLPERLNVQQLSLLNVDCTVVLEAPKLKAYKPVIQARLAELLALPLERVAVKAKTAEGLGPVGAGQAIEASVSVLLQLA